jgi:hypothetical protein
MVFCRSDDRAKRRSKSREAEQGDDRLSEVQFSSSSGTFVPNPNLNFKFGSAPTPNLNLP